MKARRGGASQADGRFGCTRVLASLRHRCMPAEGRRRLRGNLLLLAASLLVLEVVGRFVFGGAEQAGLYEFERFADGRCVRMRPDTEVSYTGWFLRIPAVRHEVNALGFRGPA